MSKKLSEIEEICGVKVFMKLDAGNRPHICIYATDELFDQYRNKKLVPSSNRMEERIGYNVKKDEVFSVDKLLSDKKN